MSITIAVHGGTWTENHIPPSKYVKHTCRERPLPLPIKMNLITKSEFVVNENHQNYNSLVQTGMGSAYGGQWKPKKPEDERFLGKPGEIKTTFKNGYRIDTKIGEESRAVYERHYTDHNRADKHTKPHDHNISWDPDRGSPLVGPPINYPNGAPEFKGFKEINILNKIVHANSLDENRFKTISDFKWCVNDGGEVEFIWNSISYTITHPEGKINISEANRPETEKWCNSADEVLEYMVGKDRLRDVITKVTVIDRTI